MMRATIYVPDQVLPANFEQMKFQLLEPKFDGKAIQPALFEARLSELDDSFLACEFLSCECSATSLPPHTHFSIRLGKDRLYGHIVA